MANTLCVFVLVYLHGAVSHVFQQTWKKHCFHVKSLQKVVWNTVECNRAEILPCVSDFPSWSWHRSSPQFSWQTQCWQYCTAHACHWKCRSISGQWVSSALGMPSSHVLLSRCCHVRILPMTLVCFVWRTKEESKYWNVFPIFLLSRMKDYLKDWFRLEFQSHSPARSCIFEKKICRIMSFLFSMEF